MGILSEAFRRKEGETRTLVITRVFVAVIMHLGFLIYVGYLIFKIATDDPFLELSFENLSDNTEMPLIDMVPLNPSFRLSSCSYDTSLNGNTEIPNWRQFFQDISEDTRPHYLLDITSTYSIAEPKTESLESATGYRFRWEYNATEYPIGELGVLPYVEVRLFHPSFYETIEKAKGGDQKKIADKLFYDDVTTILSTANHATIISFDYEDYLAIRTRSVSSLIGFSSNPVNITTVPVSSQDAPLIPGNSSEIYSGFFYLKLRGHQKMIKKEIRQNNFIESVSLAGGWYGMFIAAYLFIFGMIPESPWGVVHRIPFFYNNKAAASYTQAINENTILVTKE